MSDYKPTVRFEFELSDVDAEILMGFFQDKIKELEISALTRANSPSPGSH